MYKNRTTEALVGGLARLDRLSVDLLDLSLRRDLPDAEIALRRGIPATEVGEHRARALARLMSELRIERFDDVVDLFTRLADLPAERWAQATDAAGSPVALSPGWRRRAPWQPSHRASTALVALATALAMALALPQSLTSLALPSHRSAPAVDQRPPPPPLRQGSAPAERAAPASPRARRPAARRAAAAPHAARTPRATHPRPAARPAAHSSLRRHTRSVAAPAPAAPAPAAAPVSAAPAPVVPPPPPSAKKGHPQKAKNGRGARAEPKLRPVESLPPGKAKRLPNLKVPVRP